VRRLDESEYDAYVGDTARVAEALGVIDPPRDQHQLADQLASYRDELHATAEALDAARFLLFSPPLPWPARLPYGVLAASAVSLLPRWAHDELRLPYFPLVEKSVVTVAGRGLTSTIRWAMRPPPRDAHDSGTNPAAPGRFRAGT
jgi:uncharacterized protein (DUF2236 family)